MMDNTSKDKFGLTKDYELYRVNDKGEKEFFLPFELPVAKVRELATDLNTPLWTAAQKS
jgi:hypothetical protein